jgi:hypothetical protein
LGIATRLKTWKPSRWPSYLGHLEGSMNWAPSRTQIFAVKCAVLFFYGKDCFIGSLILMSFLRRDDLLLTDKRYYRYKYNGQCWTNILFSSFKCLVECLYLFWSLCFWNFKYLFLSTVLILWQLWNELEWR